MHTTLRYSIKNLTESGEALTKIGPNVYARSNTTLTFNVGGFTMTGGYTDTDGSTVTWNCTSARQ